MRVIRVDEEQEVKRVDDWEIHFLTDGGSARHPHGVNIVMTSSEPTEEEIEVVNQRMVAVDGDVVEEVESLRKVLKQSSWAPPPIKKAEPEYVNEVEKVLENLTEPLQVVYNVNLSEARGNLETWREALTKELEVVSRGFRRVTAEEFRREGYEGNPNVTYVPSKVVYTIKPPDQASSKFFKRKARIVACGNYCKDEGEELYASGASGETLRCIF